MKVKQKMNISVFWARVLGFHTVIMSIWAFEHLKIINPLESQIMADFISNPLYLFNIGIFNLFMGLVICVSHQVWRRWPLLITLLGYWIVAKGIILLFFVGEFHELIVLWQGENSLIRSILEFMTGTVLLTCGFFLPKKV